MGFKYYSLQAPPASAHAWQEADFQPSNSFAQQSEELAELLAPAQAYELESLPLNHLINLVSQQSQTFGQDFALDQKAEQALKTLEQAFTALPQKNILVNAHALTLGAYASWLDLQQQEDFVQLLQDYCQLLAQRQLTPASWLKQLQLESKLLSFWGKQALEQELAPLHLEGFSSELTPGIQAWLSSIINCNAQVVEQQYYLALELHSQNPELSLEELQTQAKQLPVHLAISGGKDSLVLYWSVFFSQFLFSLGVKPLALLLKEQKPQLASLSELANLTAYFEQDKASAQHFYQTSQIWQHLWANHLEKISISHVYHGIQQISQNWQIFVQKYGELTQKLLNHCSNLYEQLQELSSYNQYVRLTQGGFSQACKFYDLDSYTRIKEIEFKLNPLSTWEFITPNQNENEFSQRLKLALTHINNTEQQARFYRYGIQYWRLENATHLHRGVLFVAHQLQDLLETFASSMLRLYPYALSFDRDLVDLYAHELQEGKVLPIMRNLNDFTYEPSSQFNPFAGQKQSITIAKTRPLLNLRLEQIEQILASIGTLVVEDPMNQDQSYTRVAVRNTFAKTQGLLEATAQVYNLNQSYTGKQAQANLQLLENFAGFKLAVSPLLESISQQLPYPQSRYLALMHSINLYPHLLKEQIMAWDYHKHLEAKLEPSLGLALVNIWLWLEAKVQLNLAQYQQLLQVMQAPETKAAYFGWHLQRASKDYGVILRHQGHLLLVSNTQLTRFLQTNPPSRLSLFSEQGFASDYSLQGHNELVLQAPERIVFPLKNSFAKQSIIINNNPGTQVKFEVKYLETSSKFSKLLRSRNVPWLWSQFLTAYCQAKG
ncbi:hypothetical protein CJP74_00115 [Psittacicella melopsittaci]|uniref:Uncharacterized protein n=1 Tax=Psittacicella melopsittaci TaxID=2028576 RepID=A0A3A1Y938_9GAMM|nr:ATP-binding protein [Psittacicella melopsittaci]RIY34195.1 hypothetical protein CJP74_00115 [Psittacicella melopsittaci]